MIDTHCHIFKEYYKDQEKIIKEMNGQIIVSSDEPKEFQEVLDLTKYTNVYGTLGIQPEYSEKYKKEDLITLEKLLKKPKIKAIGEIGLDYHYNMDKQKQKELFIYQIKLANKYNLPIVVHSRDAKKDTIEILKKYKNESTKCDLHCYSYDANLAKELIKHNIYLGIGGILTFKNEQNLKEVVKEIPLDYILLETDSPYLSPEPLRGKINEPKNIYYVAQKISQIKNIPLEKVLKQTTQNAKKFFNI